MTRNEFEKLVTEGFAKLPEKFRKKIKNVGFLVEDEPSPEVRKEVGLRDDETLLGFYRGIPRTVRGADYGVGPTLPDVIYIFQKPTEEEAAGDPEQIKQIVADTVWHEVAHYFGFGEEAVAERELTRRSQ